MKFPNLRQSILATPKQRKRFFWFRNISALGIGVLVSQVHPTFGVWLSIPAALLAYFTVSPIIALIVCYIEEMLS